jgi:hypothetical protein
MVMMALVTTLMASPLFELGLYRRPRAGGRPAVRRLSPNALEM